MVLLLITAAFLLGNWIGAKSETSIIGTAPPISEEEKAWQEQGLLIGDGIYFVGSDIDPGIYRTRGTDTSLYGCSWQRLSGFGAENDNIIVSYYEDKGMPTIVAIAPTDKGFKTQGCGRWYEESLPVTEDMENFGDGAFIVGIDVKPGIYRSSVSAGCYWERLSGFSREFYSGRLFAQDEELIVRSNNTVVEINATDRGFISYNCKEWIKQ